MLAHIPFSEIKERHVAAMLDSVNAAPADDVIDVGFLLQEILAERMRLFEYDHGCMVVTKRGKRLAIVTCTARIWRIKALAEDMKRLAADWECDIVETMVFDSRLADAIVKIGGQVESFVLTLPVGN